MGKAKPVAGEQASGDCATKHNAAALHCASLHNLVATFGLIQ
jgi:hypothetical protein